MITVVLASNNAHKRAELEPILGEYGVRLLTLAEAGVVSEPEETGVTFRENAMIKARAACEASGLAAIADDSGLCADALDGAPGVYSARYKGGRTDAERNALLLDDMAGRDNRAARFVCVMALCFPDGRHYIGEGAVEGVLLEKGRGASGFGYDPLFFLPEKGMTTAELSAEEKNALSHRARAARNLAEKMSRARDKAGAVLFGGAFDPPHNGHLAVLKALSAAYPARHLIVMPTGRPPHKGTQTAIEHRMAMVRLMAEAVPRVEVSDFEARNADRLSYTADTLRAMSVFYGELTLAVGGDMLYNIESWNRAGQLLRGAEIVALDRGDGRDIEAMAENLRCKYGARVRIISCRTVAVSSTEMRRKPEKALIPERVYEYILSAGLYGGE